MTRAERLSIAAEVGRIILKLQENSQGDVFLNENKPANENWLSEMGKSSGTPTQTLYRWWTDFTKSAGLDMTLAAEVGRLCLKLRNQSNAGNESNLDSDWFIDWYDKSRLTKPTAYNWWSAFTKSAGLDMTLAAEVAALSKAAGFVQ